MPVAVQYLYYWIAYLSSNQMYTYSELDVPLGVKFILSLSSLPENNVHSAVVMIFEY